MSAAPKLDVLTLSDLGEAGIDAVIARGLALKAARARREPTATLPGRVLAMIFEKASTRTRVSFEVGMFELGGHAVFLQAEGSQIGRGEPIEDTARVLGGYCHAIAIRTFGQDRAEALARWSPVPVINALTDLHHPCQILADLITAHERLGDARAPRYAWVGDGNNMANSWIEAAGLLGLDLALACPAGYDPDPAIVAAARAAIARRGRGALRIERDPRAAVDGAHVVSTDVWASMGQEEEAAARRSAFDGFRVDEALMAGAAKGAIVLHCLPAHRGEEISAGVIESTRAAVWQQAENRLHAQKALLERVVR